MFRPSLIAFSLIAGLLPTLAVADPLKGLYIGGAVGLNIPASPSSAGGTAEVDTNLGPAGVVDLGWGFGNGLRAEIEADYRSNGVSDIKTLRTNGQLVPLTNIRGSMDSNAFMANVEYDIPRTFMHGALQPYIGAGLGYDWLRFMGTSGVGNPVIKLPDNNTYSGPGTISFGGAGAFAYQAILGLSIPIPGVKGLSATAEYRFFGTARADIPARAVANTNNLVNDMLPEGRKTYGFELHDNSLMLGLRYAFGTL